MKYYSLYDVGKDPFEKRGYYDVLMADYPVHPDVQDRFTLVPEELAEAMGDLLSRKQIQRDNAEKISFGHKDKKLSRAEVERLYELGYLDEESYLELITEIGG